jgi:hypothetical protein
MRGSSRREERLSCKNLCDVVRRDVASCTRGRVPSMSDTLIALRVESQVPLFTSPWSQMTGQPLETSFIQHGTFRIVSSTVAIHVTEQFLVKRW